MYKTILVMVLAATTGCVHQLSQVERASKKRAEFPNIRVTTPAENGSDNINIKRGRQSFLNYSLGTPSKRVVSVMVSDEAYEEMRDLCFAVLRELPPKSDKGKMIHINLLLLGEEIIQNGLKTNSCTFRHQPGAVKSVDRLLLLTGRLLDEHREKQK